MARVAAAGVVALPLLGGVLRGGVDATIGFGLCLVLAALAMAAALAPDLRAAPADLGWALSLWGLLAIAQLAWAADLDAALDAGSGLLAALLALLVAAVASGQGDRDRLVAAFAYAAAGLGAVAWIVWLAAEPSSRARFPFGNPNHLAAWSLLPTAIALAALAGPGCERAGPSAVRRAAWLAVLASALAAIAASRSRGGALAALAAAAALLTLRWLPSPLRARGTAAAFVTAALALAVLPWARPEWVSPAGAEGEFSPGLRWSVYAASSRAAWEAAPLGTGLGGFAPAFVVQRPAGLAYAARHAHNEVLHAGVELGVPFLAVALPTLWLAVRRASRVSNSGSRLAAWGGGLAVLAVAAHALVDLPLRAPAVALAVAALAGLAWGSDAAALASRRARRSTRAALAGLALVLAALSGTGLQAAWAERRADTRMARGDFAGAEEAARRGLAFRPARVGLLTRAAEAAEHRFALAGGTPAARERALADREAAVQASPARADLRIALARARHQSKDTQAALVALKSAATLDPRSPRAHLARARVLLREGRPGEAAEALREALSRHPLAAFDVVTHWVAFTGDPGSVGTFVPARRPAILGAGRALARSGYPREAADLLEPLLVAEPEDARTALEAIRFLRTAGEHERAASVLVRALVRSPQHPGLLGEQSRLARARSRPGRTRGDAS